MSSEQINWCATKVICKSEASTKVTAWQLWTQHGIIFNELKECSENDINYLTKWQVKHTLGNTIEDFSFPTMINREDGPQWTQWLCNMVSPDHAHALADMIAPFINADLHHISISKCLSWELDAGMDMLPILVPNAHNVMMAKISQLSTF